VGFTTLDKDDEPCTAKLGKWLATRSYPKQTGELTFSMPKNLSLPSSRIGPTSAINLSSGDGFGALESFLPELATREAAVFYRSTRSVMSTDRRPLERTALPLNRLSRDDMVD
jgi:hypothetical protein